MKKFVILHCCFGQKVHNGNNNYRRYLKIFDSKHKA